ncbi:uncharacterized protein LOC120505002 [Passer montanus]|uniref:uncharacterized protein LOC120505002 n=1 Tax=Passer montanus TaxID=9160 RepID=UPI001960FCC3|nr:uncharacterized protein LOC120505002 [Passer montanus]XP_039570993.1 uncharacterized protein LOC120505002 [Passer montanus]XP_039570994.1 uncharacterized protein LOC120505002 [Passer montanus]XP_039570995.1 uncharacterized protein LOC120505002 [Passer montanus]
MNTASTSESGSYSTNNPGPFIYAQSSAQQPYPNPWCLSYAYSPYCVPAPGFRSGNPYFPFYSVALHEYPRFFVPQHPVHARINRRPYFNAAPSSPMFYHATRFRHYNSSGKKMETKETQTDPRQPESKQKRHQDIRTETKGCGAGNTACVSPGIGTETETTSEKRDSFGSSIVVDREFHNKSPASSTQYRNLPTGSYAFEKEEVRIEYGNGSPAIQLWKSFKETIPLYDAASGKPVSENILPHDLFSLSSCEGLLYGPHEGENMLPGASLDERKAVVTSKQGAEAVQEKDVQNNEVELDAEKMAKSPPGETMAVQITELARSVGVDQPVVIAKKSSTKRAAGSKTSQEEPSFIQQAGLLPSNMEVMSDFQQKKLNLSHNATGERQTEKSIWCDKSIEKFAPSSSWLACLDSMDTNYNACLPQRKCQSVISLSSDDMSSGEEGSSTDNAPVSYFVPDNVLQKSTYTLQKSTDGLEQIKGGGSPNVDEAVGKEQVNSLNDQDVNSSNTKIKEASSKGRKLGALSRSSSRKEVDSPSKKATKSLSEVEDSEEYSVKGEEEDEDGEDEYEDDEDDDMDEIEYFFQEAPPYCILRPSKGNFYQVGQRVLWKPSTNAVPAQLISWPAQEKIKTRSGLVENIGVVYKPKKREQDEVVYSDYGYYGRKRPMTRREGLEHQRMLRKFLRGRLLRENVGILPEEYWIRSGAKPRFTSQICGSFSPPARSKEQVCQPLVKPKKRRMGKPPSKRRDARQEMEEVETWELPKHSTQKGHGTKKSLSKKR